MPAPELNNEEKLKGLLKEYKSKTRAIVQTHHADVVNALKELDEQMVQRTGQAIKTFE